MLGRIALALALTLLVLDLVADMIRHAWARRPWAPPPPSSRHRR